MQARIVKIGSSVGVIIPNSIVKEASLQVGKVLDLQLINHTNIMLTKKTPRQGWDLAAKEMHEAQDDQLLIPDIFEDENLEDWK